MKIRPSIIIEIGWAQFAKKNFDNNKSTELCVDFTLASALDFFIPFVHKNKR